MNFFEQQDQAQKKTIYLYLLMAIAVVSLISIACMSLAYWVNFGNPQSVPVWRFWEVIPPKLLTVVVLGILFIIVSASGFEYLKLRSGGAAVAQALGGQLIPQNTTNFAEKRILNIVEEMALASGVPVPPVYVLNDESINAFAAGHNIDNAVIGVTRGCITKLSRDEQQGVIAHEFSHIFHGDMKINMRLSALLFGILFIALIGEFMLRSSRVRSSNGRSNPLPLIGLALFILGYCGVLFANLIKAAVSRQREFLADASAIQYTRNPSGIAGALHKISLNGSALSHPNAAQFSHMYFSVGVSKLTSLFATHPPLKDRISRIDPKGETRIKFETSPSTQAPNIHSGINAASAATANAPTAKIIPFVGGSLTSNAIGAEDTTPITAPQSVDDIVDTVGLTTPEHLQYARHLIASLPDELTHALHEPYQVRGIILGLFLDKQDLHAQQWNALPESLFSGERDQLTQLALCVNSLQAPYRLPILEMAIPTLKQLPQDLIDELLLAIDIFIRSDEKLTIDEWCLSSILHAQTQEQNTNTKAAPDLNDIGLLLSAIVRQGHKELAATQAAFTAATQGLSLDLIERDQITIRSIENSLTALANLPSMKKLAFLKRLSIAVMHDNKITYREAELLRAIAARLACPMPPLLIGS